jgi:hypothetical protein
MAEYLIFFNDEWVTEATDEQWQQRSRDVRALADEMKAAGVFIFLGGLDNEGEVFHVEPRDGTPVFTDGPYAETKETFGGFTAVNVPDQAAARYWAGRVALACDWPQEVRIFRNPAQVPAPDADRVGATGQEA